MQGPLKNIRRDNRAVWKSRAGPPNQRGAARVQYRPNLQLDAHLDIYNLSDCATELTHGNFILRASGPMPAIVNLGHRELLLRPDFILKHYLANFSGADLAIDRPGVLAKLAAVVQDFERVFLDIDCDAFDPAYFPAVKEPRPFGLDPALALQVLAAIGEERLAGVAISEFDPARDVNDRCLETLIWLIEHVLLMKYEG